MNNYKYNQNGFTLIEIITVIGIIGILTAVGVPSVIAMQRSVSFSNSVSEVKNILQNAQTKAQASQSGLGWGVRIESDNYTIYSGDWSAPNSQVNYTLDSGVTFSGIVPNEIEFDRLTGSADANNVILNNSAGQSKTLKIEQSGKISVL